MTHKTNRGDDINMAALVKANETTIAVSHGGAMNARGDLLGRGGRIIKHVDQRVNETPKSPAPAKVNLTDKRRFSAMIGTQPQAKKVEMHTDVAEQTITDNTEVENEPIIDTKPKKRRKTTKIKDEK